MSKASGSYPSMVRGVSQQVPSQRGAGRLGEQVNMVPDPVEGLCRRHGSLWQAERVIFPEVTGANLQALIDDTANWRTFEYSNDGNEYVIVYRAAARPALSQLPVMYIYNRTSNVFEGLDTTFSDITNLDLLHDGGISAITSIGKYVFFASSAVLPTANTVDLWGDADNQSRAVVWIRGGAYARKYNVTATKDDNTQVSFEYTTPTSSYQGTLDTTGVPVYAKDPAGGSQADTEAAYITAVGAFGEATLGWAAWTPSLLSVNTPAGGLTNVSPADPTTAGQYRWDAGASFIRFHPSLIGAIDVTVTYTHLKTISNPNYTKIIADLTNAYNSAVTQWIGDSAEAIQPSSIAEQLRLAAVAAGLTGATRDGSTVIFDNVTGLTVNDGGDGSLIRGVANEISSVDQVSDLHYVGKVVKVRPRSAQEAFYLKATAKDPLATGWTEVIWVEGAGVEYTITGGLFYGVSEGGLFHIASSADFLDLITPGPAPQYEPSTTGDSDTSPLPYFIGKPITYLGVFQDRLLVGAGAVVRASRSGDYLNFFRSTVLSVIADDPLEMLSQGSEDDTLRFSVLYDQDLVIFGDKRQYRVSGRNPLTPTSANMPVLSSHAHAATFAPLAAGSVIFYGKRDEVSSSVYQITPGQRTDSPESYPVSSQLNDYIQGNAIEMAKIAKPTVLFMRSSGARDTLYQFQFLDSEEGRKQDAWGRWTFAPELGTIIGMAATINGLEVFSIRAAHSSMHLVVDLCPMTAGLSSKPYLDSMREWAQIETDTGSVRTTTPGDWYAAFDDSTEYRLLGAPVLEGQDLQDRYPAATGVWVGVLQEAYYRPTNPFLRDRNDQAITTGRLTVAKMVVSMANSSGFSSDLVSKSGTVTATFNGRVLGDPNNILGRVPITNAEWSIPVGREVRDYDLTIRALTWLPFTTTLLQWVGQSFNRVQRY